MSGEGGVGRIEEDRQREERGLLSKLCDNTRGDPICWGFSLWAFFLNFL